MEGTETNVAAIDTPIDNSNTQPIVETQTVETPQEKFTVTFSDDNLSVEDTNLPNEIKTQKPADKSKGETQQVAYDFKSKFGDDFDSEEKVAEVLKSYNDLKTKAEKAALLENVPEHNKGLIEFVAKGGDAKTYIEAISKDYDKMDSKDIIREAYMLENKTALLKKGFTDKHIELKFEQEFKAKFGLEPYDEDIHDEEYKDLYEMSKIELDSIAKDVKDSLKEQQQQALKTPQAKIEDNNKKWLDLVETTAKDFKGITLKVAGEEINFKNETPDKLRDSMAGIDYDAQTHAKAMYLAANFEKIIAEVEKKATEKAYKQGQADYQKKLTNPQTLKDENNPKVAAYSGKNWTTAEANEAAKNGGVSFLN